MTVDLQNGQQFIAEAIKAAPIFNGAGLTIWQLDQPEAAAGILLDDGGDEDPTGVEVALRKRGLAIIVRQFEFADSTGHTDTLGVLLAQWAVVVQENVLQNRGQEGTGIPCPKAVTEVARAVIKAATGNPTLRRFFTHKIVNHRITNGTWECVVAFRIPVVIQ